MPRGVRGDGLALGAVCRKCGADSWTRRDREKGRWQVRYCLVCARRRSAERGAKSREKDPALQLWRSAKARAKRLGTTFTIDVEAVRQVWPADGKCPALGIPLAVGRGVMQDASPTLDRKNPAWGYESGNIAVICLRANRAKSNVTAGELESLAAWMRTEGLS